MRKIPRPCQLFLLGVLALGVSAPTASSADALSQVRSEIARLEQALAGKPDSDPDWKEAKTDLSGSLREARRSLDAGRLYLSLEELADARSSFRALETAQEGVKTVKNSASDLDSAWKQARLALTASTDTTRAYPWGQAPAALRAVAETAEGQTQVLLEASRAYADATNAEAGFYYLGQAKAAAESAAFCARLNAPKEASPLPLRSLAPELQKLQERTVAAFTPPRSIERHPAFIRLNATLKLAGELDASGLYAGSLYQYLDAVQQFGDLDLPAPSAAQRAALPGEIALWQTRLRSSREDASIARLFLERAEARLEGGKAGKAKPSEDDFQNAVVLVERVLPADLAVQKPVSLKNQRASQPITVTLVRWPYT